MFTKLGNQEYGVSIPLKIPNLRYHNIAMSRDYEGHACNDVMEEIILRSFASSSVYTSLFPQKGHTSFNSDLQRFNSNRTGDGG